MMNYDDRWDARTEAKAARELRRIKRSKMSGATKLGYYVVAPLILIAVVLVVVAGIVGVVRWGFGL